MIVCEIGYPRTATRSLAVAAKDLGLSVQHGIKYLRLRERWNLNRHILRGTLPGELYDRYDYVGNIAVIHWRQVAEAYPECKFILTIRDVDEWYDSCRRKWHRLRSRQCDEWPSGDLIGYKGNGVFNLANSMVLFGTHYPRECWRDRFNEHNERVYEWFEEEGRDRLLLFNAFAGDGHRELTDFLGIDCPEGVAFPHTTKPVR